MPKAVDGWKTCSRCKERKLVSEFSEGKHTSDGYQTWCKACFHAYYEANREEARVRSATSYAANREERLAQMKVYRGTEEGRKVRQAAERCYRLTPQGKVTAKRARQSEKGQARGRRLGRTKKGRARQKRARHTRRAREAGTASDLTLKDLALLDARYLFCNYCGHAFEVEGPFKRVLEHVVPLSRGGATTLKNLVYACVHCNQDKGTKLLKEWINRWYEEAT